MLDNIYADIRRLFKKKWSLSRWSFSSLVRKNPDRAVYLRIFAILVVRFLEAELVNDLPLTIDWTTAQKVLSKRHAKEL